MLQSQLYRSTNVSLCICLSVCQYVCVCVCLSVCLCVCLCVYVRASLCVSVCTLLHPELFACIIIDQFVTKYSVGGRVMELDCLNKLESMAVYLNMGKPDHRNTYVHTHTHTHTRTHTHTHTHTHTYTHTHTHTHTHTELADVLSRND